MDKNPVLPVLFTRQEAAAKLRISMSLLNKLINTSKLTPVTMGRRWLISEDELNNFIKKGGDK